MSRTHLILKQCPDFDPRAGRTRPRTLSRAQTPPTGSRSGSRPAWAGPAGSAPRRNAPRLNGRNRVFGPTSPGGTSTCLGSTARPSSSRARARRGSASSRRRRGAARASPTASAPWPGGSRRRQPGSGAARGRSRPTGAVGGRPAPARRWTSAATLARTLRRPGKRRGRSAAARTQWTPRMHAPDASGLIGFRPSGPFFRPRPGCRSCP